MKYVLGVLAFIVVLFLVISLVFGRGDNTVQNNKLTAELVDYSDKNSTVSVTTVGRLVGKEDRRAVRIIVTPNERRLEILSGYDQTVMSSQSYPNTRIAYTNFLAALGNLGFLGKRDTNIKDERGVCPTGHRYIYDLSQDGNHVSNLWSTTCNTPGTFHGDGATIRQLFQWQIPNYSRQVEAVRL